MKKFTYIAAIIVSLSLISCENKLLDQTSPDQLTTDAFYRNQTDAEQALAATYAQIKASDRWDVTEVNAVVENFRGDDAIPGPDSENYADWTAISNFSNSPGNSRVDIYWKDAYRGIFHANQVIENVGAMSDAKIAPEARQRIVAEAIFLRAFLHFRLINNFERIIIVTATPKSKDDLEKPLSSREEAWAQIETDLRNAANGLPAEHTADYLGRATKGAALAYLGKAYLYQKKWDAAATELKKIIDLKKYDLVNNFLSLFDGTNENSTESIFEIQYTPTRSNGRAINHVLSKFTSPGELGGWGNIEASKALLTEMKKEGKIASTGKYDSRLYWTLFFDDPDVSVFGKNFKAVFERECIIFRKYMYSAYTENDAPTYYSSFNLMQMRYADVLLMLAEALIEQDKVAEALPLMNKVRNRANMPDLSNLNKQQATDALRHERMVEFAYEGNRFFDLRRWGSDVLTQHINNSGKNIKNFDASKSSFFPIPESEVNSNSNIKL